jgi:hypothetical protein
MVIFHSYVSLTEGKIDVLAAMALATQNFQQSFWSLAPKALVKK